MDRDNVRPLRNITMTFDSFDIRAALLLIATALVSVAFASDETVDTPEHVTGA